MLTSQEKIQAAREKIGATLAGVLPIREEKSVEDRKEVVQRARVVIGNAIGSALAGVLPIREKKPQTRKEELRESRRGLEQELSSLGFWRIGKKRELKDRIREVDREMSTLLNQEQGNL